MLSYDRCLSRSAGPLSSFSSRFTALASQADVGKSRLEADGSCGAAYRRYNASTILLQPFYSCSTLSKQSPRYCPNHMMRINEDTHSCLPRSRVDRAAYFLPANLGRP